MIKPTLNTAINIAELYKEFFGQKPVIIPGISNDGETDPAAQIQPAYQKNTNLYGEPLYGQSDLLGQEVFCPVTIEVDGVDYFFPHVVVGIDRVKTVISTDMTEIGGSVHEVISNRDFEISIRGFLIGQYEQFPDEDLKRLNDAFTYNNKVRLKSALTDIFLHANDYVLITRMSVPPKPGVVGVRDFSLQLLSDSIFTLYEL